MGSHSSNNKLIAKNTFFLYIRSIILMLVALYTSRVVLQALGVEDYCIYNLVGGVVAMFSMLSSTLSTASQRFITYALGGNDFNHLKKVFSTSITLHIILGVIVVVLLEVFGVWFLNHKLNIPAERLSVANWVFQFSILTFFVNVVSVPYNALIIAHEKMSAFAYISIVDGFLKLGIALLLQWVTFDKLLLYAILYSIVAIIIRFIYSAYCTKQFVETRQLSLQIDKSLFKEMFAFSGWNFIGVGSLILRNQGIDILLNIFFGVSVNAAKGVSNQVQSAVQQFVGNFTSSVTPQLTKSVAQKDYARTNSLIVHSSRFAFFMMMLFAVPIIVYSKEILQLWLVEVPQYSVSMVKLIMICLLCDIISLFLKNTLLAFGDIRNYQLMVGSIKLLALPLAYIILKCGGSPLTGIWVNIILEIVCLGFRLSLIKKKLDFKIYNFIFKVLLLCWVVFFVAYQSANIFYYHVTDNLYIGVAFCIIITMICIFVALSKTERDLIKKVIYNKIKR